MKTNATVAMAVCCLFVSHDASASAWFQNKLVPQGVADVNVTIMRWGAPDTVDPAEKKDRIVGQVASDKFRSVTLVLEGVAADKRTIRLSITTGVHLFGTSRDTLCTQCLKSSRDGHGAGSNAKGATTSGGCFFEIVPPTQPGLQSLRIVDVQAEDKSVNYFVKFNVSPTVMRNSFKIPMSRTSTIHSAKFTIEAMEADSGGGDAKPAAPQAPATTQPSAKSNGKAVVPALESIKIGF